VFSVGLNRAVAVLAEKKTARGRAAPAALKSLGEHPEGGGEITVRDGKYGPYVAWGKIYATLPKGSDPQGVTIAQALELLSAKAGKGRGSKGAAKSSKTAAPKKATSKKTGAKSAASGGKARSGPGRSAATRKQA
jgi:DNA topoisomerase I